MNAIDLTGQRFGRLTAKHIVPKEQLPWKKKDSELFIEEIMKKAGDANE